MRAVLERGNFAFLGLIGSRTKRLRFEHLLLQRGIEAHLLERITCPIGLPLVASKAPEQIAIAAAAQLLPLLEAWSTSMSTSQRSASA